ncbi:MAG: helix-turn-helix domain-containing protein, partial [Ferruginibacter sp.]
NYSLLRDNLELLESFEIEILSGNLYTNDIYGFRKWIADNYNKSLNIETTVYEGMENGRSLESAISTLIVHLNRYAKSYSKSAIYNSPFSTQEEFIYLIVLKAFGDMTKMEIIKKNIHEKPIGMQIISRLIKNGWVKQHDSSTDKRSKIIQITQHGLDVLNNQMEKIRQATHIITGDLNQNEKIELLRLLRKLEDFHKPIFNQNIDSANLLQIVNSQHFNENNLN